ncbi:SHOCT domain-containing protein [Natronobacterium gregoryi]|uniref:Membrane protein n=2 Tax=Natronobacterium gregoryi TaxID=44930 RepID=L0AI78_NATGS|nr:SHOCT domain-containing protein [Natronobacterium gregoryi]AFZ72882.1 putative membrane protein [Natronobacterium gregoryi SP2]ELY69627.1 hypothetical protein C490_07481 [Natronobacterium gregoryi SP2]PLK21889.1 hypothetical protein CYV19_01985 [Natronobacterium gregoryi SP2]SFI66333.1 Uncharacterized membrane protein [Natronobacterium gregoryi]
MDDGLGSFFEMLMAITATATLPLGILAAVFSGFPAATAVFVIGWLLLVPIFAITSEYLGSSCREGDGVPWVRERVTSHSSESSTADERTADEDPLETLRDRYARGEIDDREFERRLERLIATEEVPEAAVGDRDERSGSGDRERLRE